MQHTLSRYQLMQTQLQKVVQAPRSTIMQDAGMSTSGSWLAWCLWISSMFAYAITCLEVQHPKYNPCKANARCQARPLQHGRKCLRCGFDLKCSRHSPTSLGDSACTQLRHTKGEVTLSPDVISSPTKAGMPSSVF